MPIVGIPPSWRWGFIFPEHRCSVNHDNGDRLVLKIGHLSHHGNEGLSRPLLTGATFGLPRRRPAIHTSTPTSESQTLVHCLDEHGRGWEKVDASTL